jgi:hypothetical protein
MKNLYIYLLSIVIPLVLLLILGMNVLEPTSFVILILVYIVIYRPIIDGLRLNSITNIGSSEKWKLYIPFYGHLKFFKQLYLRK